MGIVSTGRFHGVERSEIGLTYLPVPDFLAFSLPETHIALITNEGSLLTTKVQEALEKQGNKVVILNLPQLNKATTGNVIDLVETTDEAIATALATIEQQYGKVGTFIHLHPHLEFQNGQFAQHFQQDKTIVKTVFLLAKHLQKPLNELGQNQRANFLTVSRLDGQLGLGKRGNVSVVGGGLTGLVKSLNLEWSPVFCRAVDIQPELAVEEIAGQVIAELHDADLNHIEVGYSQQGRQTISAIPVDTQENQEIRTTVTPDSVFLVSGGARGVTASCVVEMAQSFACKFILLGRSDDAFEVPAFAKMESDESTLKRLIMEDMKARGEKPNLATVKSIFNNIIAKKEIEDTLTQIREAGGQAIYLKGDVTRLATLKPGLAKATATLGRITGIIHGAGRLADKYIQDKTETDFENVLSVKLDGLLILLQCVDIHHLDHLILFSSVAGFYGNVGQTDYAIANEILSKAAHLFKTNHPNTQVSAINWGAWDGGMVSPELKKKFEEAGVSLVNSQGGTAMMVNELNVAYANQPQVIIGGTLPMAISHISDQLQTFHVHRKLDPDQNPFLMHHVIQGNAVLPVVNAVGWMAQSCERLYPDFRIYKVEDTRLFKGVVFDGQQPTDFTLELKEIEKGKTSIVFEATVLSQGGKLPTYHYKAKITLVHRQEKMARPTFEHQLSGTYTASEGSVLYQDGSLFHGKYFQGIESILDWNREGIVLSCRAPEVPLSEQGQFPIGTVNTFFSDIQYQGMVIWVQKYHDGAKSLPLQTKSATIYEAVPFGKELFVKVNIVEDTEFKMMANCTVYDEDGKVYMYTEGATVTVSKDLKW
ncbi:MAG: hypothetical protein DHS20C18_33270 [Saprospiraceae bacterium]|nr:MAG: hypothetical protein DHS20C18_33270 [Saprospiraceae bacterium]